jgi:phospholipid/cholesterol/gamma-HCH transport system substrate-binding protein
MQSGRINYLLVGTFVLLMLGGLVVSVALLTGRTSESDDYYTVLDDSSGLKPGSHVLYMGYRVGQVAQISPKVIDDKLRFELRLSITNAFRDWQAPVDSEARVKAAGLLAAVVIDIRAGTSNQSLAPGDRIDGVEPSDVFDAVSDVADTIRRLTEAQVQPLVTTLNRTVQVLGEAIEQDGAPLLGDLHQLTDQFAERSPAILDNLSATSTSIRGASDAVQDVLDDNVEKVDAFVDNMVATSENAAALSGDLRQTRLLLDRLLTDLDLAVVDNRTDLRQAVRDLRFSLETVSAHVGTVSQNIEGTSRYMYEFGRQLRNNPGVLLRGTSQSDPDG